jgi:hypothetical protein
MQLRISARAGELFEHIISAAPPPNICHHYPSNSYRSSVLLFLKMRFFQLALFGVVFQASVVTVVASSCRCLPGDRCWPTTKEWKALNTTVGGRLVATIPLGSPCHDPTYNAAECAILQGEWHDPQLQ